MSERQIIGEPIEFTEQWAVASHLIAISFDLQSTAKKRREEMEWVKRSRVALPMQV